MIEQTMLNEVQAKMLEIQSNYDNYQVQFEVGDLVYVLGKYSDFYPAHILRVQDFSNGGEKAGGLVYYWLIPENYRHQWWYDLYFFYKRLFKQTWLPPRIIGHAVLAGEDFFRTEDEARKYEVLSGLKYYLIDYFSLFQGEKENV